MDRNTRRKIIEMLEQVAIGKYSNADRYIYDAPERVAAARVLIEADDRELDREFDRELILDWERDPA